MLAGEGPDVLLSHVYDCNIAKSDRAKPQKKCDSTPTPSPTALKCAISRLELCSPLNKVILVILYFHALM